MQDRPDYVWLLVPFILVMVLASLFYHAYNERLQENTTRRENSNPNKDDNDIGNTESQATIAVAVDGLGDSEHPSGRAKHFFRRILGIGGGEQGELVKAEEGKITRPPETPMPTPILRTTSPLSGMSDSDSLEKDVLRSPLAEAGL